VAGSGLVIALGPGEIGHYGLVRLKPDAAPMSQIRLVIFDLAGTTVKDDGQVPRAFEAALGEHGIHATAEDIQRVRGSSKREAILHFFPEAPGRDRVADAAYRSFRDHLARLYAADGIRPIDGVRDVFEWLKRRDVGLALNTGFDRDVTRLLLDALRWHDVASIVVCGDDVRAGRPAPDMILRAMALAAVGSPRHVANVGDTVLDLQAANHAHVGWNIGVLTGAHGRAALEAAPHTHLVDSVRDLPALWEGTPR
jgi:phosphoglycolate phosphatase